MIDEPVPIQNAQSFRVATRTRFMDVVMPQVLNGISFDRHIFETVSCKGGVFKGLQFKYVIFEDCYFRDCKFEKCNFTGAVFRNSNLRGSTFDGCDFSYCRFSNTVLHESIIQRNMPGYENVALELARALRVNYAQLGDSEGVNAAILAELQATKTHLYKAAFARESYYRAKYCGTARARSVAKYAWFMIMDLVWGHGESLFKLLRLLILIYISVVFWGLVKGRPFGGIFGEGFSLLWGTYKGVDF
ncbi:MAG: pentapeptide repeat-containing protein, partial [Tepidisphaeraceae bacterium]